MFFSDGVHTIHSRRIYSLLALSRVPFFIYLLSRFISPLRIGSDHFIGQLKDAYFAFEALTDHPYDYKSYLYGCYPELLSVGDCTSRKLAPRNSNPAPPPAGQLNTACEEEQEEEEEEEEKDEETHIDADLQHQLLKVSMMSTMIFEERLDVANDVAKNVATATLLAPGNRLSNRVTRRSTKKRPEVPDANGDRGAGAGARGGGGDPTGLVGLLGEDGAVALQSMSKVELQNIYRRCYEGGKGISK